MPYCVVLLNFVRGMDLREQGGKWEGLDWMHLAQDMDQLLALVNTVMTL